MGGETIGGGERRREERRNWGEGMKRVKRRGEQMMRDERMT